MFKKKVKKASRFIIDTHKTNRIINEDRSNIGHTSVDRSCLIGLKKGKNMLYYELKKGDIEALKNMIDEYIDFFGKDLK